MQENMADIIRVFDFVKEIDKMKTVLRRSLIYDGSKREDDAEHSWHLAMMAILFEKYAPFPLNMEKILKMTLVHDLVEVYAGDTFAYDVVGYSDKAEREKKAADKLFSLCPEAKALRALWEEFDAEETNDAKYAASLDRIQPFISNALNEGYTWVLNGVTKDAVYKRMAPVKEGLPAVYPYIESIILDEVKKGHIKE